MSLKDYYYSDFLVRGRVASGLMQSSLDQNNLMVLGSNHGQGYCVVFSGSCKTFTQKDSASLHPGVQMGTGKFNTGDNPVIG